LTVNGTVVSPVRAIVKAPLTGPASDAFAADAEMLTAGKSEVEADSQPGSEKEPIRVCQPASLVVA